MNIQDRNRLAENNLLATQGKRDEGGVHWEIGTDIYTLLLLSRFSHV